jgi:hypothetical protein
MAFDERTFRLACWLERITPRRWRVHLVGDYVLCQNQKRVPVKSKDNVTEGFSFHQKKLGLRRFVG